MMWKITDVEDSKGDDRII